MSEDDGVDLFDMSNPRSLFNLLPEKLRNYALRVPRDNWLQSESTIKKKAKPDFTDKCLRVNFWQAYCHAHDRGKNINLNHIVSGVCSRDYFLHLAKEDSSKLVFILTPPKSYDVMQRQILDEGLERLRDVVEMDFYDEKLVEKEGKDGQITTTKERKINASAIAEVRKVVEMLQDRVQGSVIRKVAVKGQVESIPSSDSGQQLLGSVSPEGSLAQLLSSVNAKLGEVSGGDSVGAEVIDVDE